MNFKRPRFKISHRSLSSFTKPASNPEKEKTITQTSNKLDKKSKKQKKNQYLNRASTRR